MGNIKIKSLANGDRVFLHTKGAIDEVAWDNTPTGERMFMRDKWVLKQNTESGYDLYLSKKGSETYTTHFINEPSDSVICELIQSGSIHKDMKNHHAVKKELVQMKWSIEFDGQHIFFLLKKKPKMTFDEVVNVIINEGGSVDKDGFIHRP